MSVTFASRAPMTMAPTAKFGSQQQQAKVSQFSGHNPASQKNNTAPKFGCAITTACLSMCCALPLVIAGLIAWMIRR
ncbi:MAG: hypothetical protein QE263_00030 [Vampirovibrionales bacterium]|nr:hypothetical protein [Vampirovibrionales bacterium]